MLSGQAVGGCDGAWTADVIGAGLLKKSIDNEVWLLPIVKVLLSTKRIIYMTATTWALLHGPSDEQIIYLLRHLQGLFSRNPPCESVKWLRGTDSQVPGAVA